MTKKPVVHMMVINATKRVLWWYDRSLRCWWCNLCDNHNKPLSDAEYAATRDEITETAIAIYNDNL